MEVEARLPHVETETTALLSLKDVATAEILAAGAAGGWRVRRVHTSQMGRSTYIKLKHWCGKKIQIRVSNHATRKKTLLEPE